MACQTRSRGMRTLEVALLLFFLLAVVLPLVRMFSRLADPEVREVFATPAFATACMNSLVVAGVTTVISVLVALLMSWVLCRTAIRGKGVFAVLLTVPMLVPSLAHGMSLVYLLGSNGILTNLLQGSWSIYGYPGIVMGSFLYSFPPAFLMLYDVMRYEDATPYQAADVLGIPRGSQFAHITMPFLRKPLVSAVFATFALVITDYGVPLMVGGKVMTLPVLMYQNAVGLLDFDTGAAIGFVLLIPAVIDFLVDVLARDRASARYVSRGFDIKPSVARDALGYAAAAFVTLVLLAPIATFCMVAFVTKYPLDLAPTLANVGRAFTMGAGSYWVNSLYIALMVSILGTVLAYLVAYITARVGGMSACLLHLASVTTLAVPGIVLGLSFALAFSGSFIYGTFAILILVNLVHFIASPYLMAYHSLSKVNKNLEAVGQTMGVGRMRIVLDVLVPATADTIAEMFSFFFVNCMVTISAVSFLATTLDMPLALLVTDLDAQRLVECSAFVSVLILVTNVIEKLVVTSLRRHRHAKLTTA
ncbi:ABC transporter permease subunit [Olsenella sp. Marseille-P4559]|uniref:ABC transporter permease subunit n=1 Tax=Olsenella sp. Marseille-P4559 TaxID=2364795 RepID=UPI001A922302|nr:ABC transporter permease subunit [Olsenella sp. Marseille-P4559]